MGVFSGIPYLGGGGLGLGAFRIMWVFELGVKSYGESHVRVFVFSGIV